MSEIEANIDIVEDRSGNDSSEQIIDFTHTARKPEINALSGIKTRQFKPLPEEEIDYPTPFRKQEIDTIETYKEKREKAKQDAEAKSELPVAFPGGILDTIQDLNNELEQANLSEEEKKDKKIFLEAFTQNAIRALAKQVEGQDEKKITERIEVEEKRIADFLDIRSEFAVEPRKKVIVDNDNAQISLADIVKSSQHVNNRSAFFQNVAERTIRQVVGDEMYDYKLPEERLEQLILNEMHYMNGMSSQIS